MDNKTKVDLQRAADLIKSLSSNDSEQKFVAAQNIPFIAQQIGPVRTVNELVPYLPGI